MYIHVLCTHIIYDLLNGNANSTELLSMAGFYIEYVLYRASVSLVQKKNKNRCMSVFTSKTIYKLISVFLN